MVEQEHFIGIDPSFSRTGVALIRLNPDCMGEVILTGSIIAPKYETNKYELENTMEGAKQIAIATTKLLKGWHKEYPITQGVVEYPVLATRSGAYLGLIQQALYSYYPWLELRMLGVPSNAIYSLSKYKSKSELVSFCRDNFTFSCETMRRGRWCINHDECSAVVLAYISYLLRIKKYKNSSKLFYPQVK